MTEVVSMTEFVGVAGGGGASVGDRETVAMTETVACAVGDSVRSVDCEAVLEMEVLWGGVPVTEAEADVLAEEAGVSDGVGVGVTEGAFEVDALNPATLGAAEALEMAEPLGDPDEVAPA